MRGSKAKTFRRVAEIQTVGKPAAGYVWQSVALSPENAAKAKTRGRRLGERIVVDPLTTRGVYLRLKRASRFGRSPGCES